jgi:hypothetical protein
LSRFTRKGGVGTWISLANRGVLDYENTVGWFNTGRFLGIHSALGWQGADWLAAVKQQLNLAIEHQRLSNNLIRECLNGSFTPSELPVFFDMIKEDPSLAPRSPRPNGIEVNRLRFDRRRKVRQPLGVELIAISDGGEITLTAGYNSARIPQLVVEQILATTVESINWLQKTL